MLLTLAVAPAPVIVIDLMLTWRLSTSASWFLIAASQALVPPSLVTIAAAKSLVQIFFSSAAVASDCRFEIAWTASCCSPLKPLVETVVLQAPRASARRAREGRAMARLVGE